MSVINKMASGYSLQYWLLMLVFFLASFRSADVSNLYAVTYSVPMYVAVIQEYSSYVVIICMVLSILVGFKNRKRFSKSHISAINYFLFLLIVFVSTDLALNDLLIKIFFLVLTCLYFCWIISGLDSQRVLLFIFVGIFLFTLANFISYFMFPNTVWKGRLFGLTSHPNFTGLSSAISCVLSFYYFSVTKWKEWKTKLVYTVAIGIGISVCLFSGSRASLLTVFVGLSCLLNNIVTDFKFKFVLILLLLLSVLILLNSSFSLSSVDYEERGNTRADTWANLADAALEFPLLGRGRTGPTSNSYLFAIAAGGVLGAVFLLSVLVTLVVRLKVFSIKTVNSDFIIYKMLMSALLLAALFEGFLLDQLSVGVLVFWYLILISARVKSHPINLIA